MKLHFYVKTFNFQNTTQNISPSCINIRKSVAQGHIHPFSFIHSFIPFFFVSLSVAFDVMRPPVTDRKVDVAHLTDPFPLKLIQEMGILLSRAAGIC